MILKARPENGSSSEHLRTNSSSVPGFVPVTAATSIGDGRKSTTASSIGCTPLFLKAAPHSTGTNVLVIVPLRMHFFSVVIVRHLAVEIGLHGGVVHLDRHLDQLVAVFFGLILEVVRNVADDEFGAQRLVLPDQALHGR